VKEILAAITDGFSWFVIGYFVILNSWYLVLLSLAALDLREYQRAKPYAGYDDLFASPLTPPVSIVVAAHNEQSGIVESVNALLGLRYPEFEVIVVDDGSDDDTFGVLERTFQLAQMPTVVPDLVPVSGWVQSVHVARGGEALTVVRKTSIGSKTDPNNVGINVSRYPLVCFVDADSLLDTEALLRVAKPFFDDPGRTVAAGGTIRAVNGSRIYRGQVVDARMPRQWLARIQVVEYLRSFLFGRAGWSRLQGLLVISGAFGIFKRSILIEIGGFRHGSVGEDADLVARMHRVLRERKADYRISFVAEPVCWTEVPETGRQLGRQRRRWSRGLAEVLWSERRMMCNPRYGRVGLVVLPYFLVFELIGPVIELTGLVVVAFGLVFGVVDIPFGLLFMAVAIGYGLFLSFAALMLEEISFYRFDRRSDLIAALGAAVLENVGYRQRHAWWRMLGLIDAVTRRNRTWGHLQRMGFQTDVAAGPELAVTPFHSPAPGGGSS
jgi:cellulose synthase/poly-beta-1,6-N-acetylglucosamine synthase-like glycosyltransferase